MWMVRAGKANRFINDFLDKGIIAIGWDADASHAQHWEDIFQQLQHKYPDRTNPNSIKSWAQQVFRFKDKFRKGDEVITCYEQGYYIGEITGDYEYHQGQEGLVGRRKVEWDDKPILRDDLRAFSKQSLSSDLTIFSVRDSIREEIIALHKDQKIKTRPIDSIDRGSNFTPTNDGEIEEGIKSAANLENEAMELIKDKIAKLDWQEMEKLVAGMLRAKGYKTRMTPIGPDGGKDVIASHDGLGLSVPRIIAEVKHRSRERIGEDKIKSFIEGMSSDDKGLYVSTGGFTKDALKRADSSKATLTLMDIGEFLRVLLNDYEALDSETKALLPLSRIYWPN